MRKVKIKVARKQFNIENTGDYYYCFGQRVPNYTYSYYDIDVFIAHLLKASEKVTTKFDLELIKMKEFDEVRHHYEIILKTRTKKAQLNSLVIALFNTDEVISKGFELLSFN